MNLQDKIVCAHKGYFNKECEKIYRENSVDVCKISTTKDYIGIIELDVRKSKDGVLYCYHGTLIQYLFVLKIPRKFSDIKKKYNVSSLEEILEVITENKSIFLDLKSKSIIKTDILNVFDGKEFKEIILGNASLTFLERFNNMPKQFVKAMIGNIFCNFYNLKDLKDRNYKYYCTLFPFQVSGKMIERVKKSGLEFVSAAFFRNRKSYWKIINKYNIKYIISDFI